MEKRIDGEKPREFVIGPVGEKELTEERYTSKHGLTLRRPANISNVHWSIICSMADKDPDLIENMSAGRYMPRCNGVRTVYRGKDTKLGMKMAFLNFLFDPVIIGLILLGILALILM
jgi:hypothetical protein